MCGITIAPARTDITIIKLGIQTALNYRGESLSARNVVTSLESEVVLATGNLNLRIKVCPVAAE